MKAPFHRLSKQSDAGGGGLADWFAPSLMLLTPLVVFLRHQEYSLLSPESLLCFTVLSIAGVCMSVAGRLLGDYVKVAIYVVLVVFVVDFQGGVLWGTANRIVLLASSSLLFFWLIRTRLSAFVCAVFGSMVISSVALPLGNQISWRFDNAQPVGDQDLPPLVHIILDEHIGVEGIDPALDPQNGATLIKEFFVDRGFTVFGKAYSLSHRTKVSIGTTFNFSFDRRRFSPGKREQGSTLYFEEMRRRGYRINVYQTDHVNFCTDENGQQLKEVAACLTYPIEKISSIGETALPMTTVAKSQLIFGMYMRLSVTLRAARKYYDKIRSSRALSWIGLPELSTLPRLSPLSSLSVLDEFRSVVAAAEPGNMYFLHILLPHYPYAFDSECEVRPLPWLSATGRGGNDPEARANRYKLYLEQVRCTLGRLAELFDQMEASGRFLETRFVLHGDHGSRIVRGESSRSNMIDRLSTLFVYRAPNSRMPGRYDVRLAPINVLLPEVMGIKGYRLEDREFRRPLNFEAGRLVESNPVVK